MSLSDLLFYGDGSSQHQPAHGLLANSQNSKPHQLDTESTEEVQNTLPPFEFPYWETDDGVQVSINDDYEQEFTRLQRLSDTFETTYPPQEQEQLANRNLAGLSLPAQTIGKVQDGLPDSTVRLRSALEGRTKARQKPNPRTAEITASLPPVVPRGRALPAPQPSRKKRSFAELLTSGTHADKENSSAAANTDSGAADKVLGSSSAAANSGKASIDAGSSVVPGTNTVRTATKPPKPAQQSKRRRSVSKLLEAQ
ncbi:hypothetical protein ABBQ32_009763 [Trebouxia sp. C0010 RCD-2024]